MTKILTIIGARPQFIKAAVLSKALRRPDLGIEEVIVHTGQHWDEEMSGRFFSDLAIPRPAYQLQLRSTSALARAGEMLQGLAPILAQEQPDAVAVYGDTDSTLAGAWAAARLDVRLIHIEAGLRSGDRSMPEEINRIGTDHWATHLCCPTEAAVEQLRSEGIVDGLRGRRVAVVGDLQCAAALNAGPFDPAAPAGPVLLTMHRPANVDNPSRLLAWLDAIGEALLTRGLHSVFPIHPRTKAMCEQMWGGEWRAGLAARRIEAREPAGYHELMQLAAAAPVVLTDSGGLQKEAFVLGTKVLVLRPVTEWKELVSLGAARCVAHPADLAAAWTELSQLKMQREDIYGAVNAGERLADQIAQWLS